MRLITPSEFRPVVRIANRHPVNPGQVWGPRTIPDLQFICPLRGSFFLRQGADEWVARPGQVLTILPDVAHSIGLVPGSGAGEMSGMHLELIPGAQWAAGEYRCDPLPPALSTPADGAEIQAAFKRAAQAYAGYGRLRDALLSTIAGEALLRLASSWGTRATPRASSKVSGMVAHIRLNAVAGVDRHELARVFDLTPEHVNALFRRELGLTPRDVLNHERCRLAYRLIHDEGLPIATAALRAGYQDTFYFSRVFNQIYSMPPSHAR